MTIFAGVLLVILILVVIAAFYERERMHRLYSLHEEKLTAEVRQREQEFNRRMYELAILKELGERIGYSLNIEKIIDIITGSLSQFIEYCGVAYMLIEPEKVVYKIHLEKSVSRKFIDNVRDTMLESLSALLDKKLIKNQVEETLSGAILVEELEDPARSIFHIPLVIGEKAVGVLTVADTRNGLYKEAEMTILYKIIRQASQAVTRLGDVVKTEQRKLNAMVSSMAEGVVMTDNDYRIVVVNSAARRMINALEVGEVSIFNFIDNLSGRFDIRGKLEESVKLNKILTADEVFIGDHFYQIIVSPVKTKVLGKEEILGGVVIFHDITHEKELERMREDFTSMIVHELRTPLTNIRGTSELLKKRMQELSSEKVSASLDLLERTSYHLLTLINDLLDVAKLESGKFTVYKKMENLNDIIKDVISVFTNQAQDKNLHIRVLFDDKLPLLEIDKMRISQVMQNLISNAIKYTTQGEIVITTKNQTQDVLVSIRDTGLGISEKDIPTLFSKFRQITTSAHEASGTGLGLVIARGIVESHGGKIWVESEVNAGSTFNFTLPIEN